MHPFVHGFALFGAVRYIGMTHVILALGKEEDRIRMVHLDFIYQELIKIRQRLTDIEREMNDTSRQPVHVEEGVLLELPDNLRKSYLIVTTLKKAGACDVSAKSGRSRAIESFYLNELERMGWLEKKRERRTIYFTPSARMKMLDRVKSANRND